MGDASAVSRASTLKGAVRQALGNAKLDRAAVFFRALQRGVSRDPKLTALITSAQSVLSKHERKLAADLEALLTT